MEYKYDTEADAIYINLSDKPYAYGKDLDDERRIDYASDKTPIGVELLRVSEGVNIDGLPNKEEIAESLEIRGIKTYTIETKPYYSEAVFVMLASALLEGKAQFIREKEEVTV